MVNSELSLIFVISDDFSLDFETALLLNYHQFFTMHTFFYHYFTTQAFF